jgi:hypothetical protein
MVDDMLDHDLARCGLFEPHRVVHGTCGAYHDEIV